MQRNSRALTSLAFFLLVLFTAGVVQLFHLRFERGDLYPPYSSLRTDPLGARALYESFGALSGITVKRNYKLPATGSVGPDTTLFYLGAKPYRFSMVSDKDAESMDRFVAAGGRLIIAMYPELNRDKPENECGAVDDNQEQAVDEMSPVDTSGKPEDDQTMCEESAEEEKNTVDDEKEQMEEYHLVDLLEHFGFGFGRDAQFDTTNSYASVVARDPNLPASIVWHSELYFNGLAQDWRIIYERDGYPVIIEKQIGAGAIILVADSYLFSNEALVKARYPSLLAHLAGEHTVVVFDEVHLGLSKTPGTVSLLRRYQLHWFIIGLLVLAGLFVWKNSVSFIPPRDHEFPTKDQYVHQEKDYTEGLISLLRRYVAPKDLLAVGLNEWNKHPVPGRRVDPATKEKVESVINAKGHEDPVAVYRTVMTILSKEC